MKTNKPVSKKYTASWQALYFGKAEPRLQSPAISSLGDARDDLISKPYRRGTPGVKRPPCASEASEQIALVTWCQVMNIPVVHIPNGAKRSMSQGRRLAMQGLAAGFPDLFIPIVNKKYAGLFIELKRVFGSATTPKQKEWIEKLNKAGYFAVVAKGYEDAVKVIEKYLADT